MRRITTHYDRIRLAQVKRCVYSITNPAELILLLEVFHAEQYSYIARFWVIHRLEILRQSAPNNFVLVTS
jgi:hypothetical protein